MITNKSIYSAFKTCLEMIEDREYYVSNDLKELTKIELKEKYTQNPNEGLCMIFTKKDDNEKILVAFKMDKRPLKKEDLTMFVKNMKDKNIKRGIVIGREKNSAINKRFIVELNFKTEFNIEYFDIISLEFNITKNEIVPKHFLVSCFEKKMILKKYKTKENKLPKILITDPMACYLGLKKGDMVKILRASPSIGFYAYYRICVGVNN